MLNQFFTTNKIALQWIPAHCSIAGNETDDRPAKESAQKEQFRHGISQKEEEALVKCQNT